MGQQSLSSEGEDEAQRFFFFFFSFSPGFVKFLRGHVTTSNLSYSDQADLLNTGAAPSGNFMSPSREIVTAAAAEVSQVQQNWDELPSLCC